MNVHVVLIRPGATLYDEQQRLQGSLDLPLSARGVEESANLANRLASTGLAALYCGPAESARATAMAIGRAAGVRARVLDELRNLDQGLWQGLQLEEIRRRNLKLYRQWLENPRTICPPNGETVEDALARVKSALRPLLKRHRNQRVGVVVPEPLAQLVGAYLTGNGHPQLVESPATGFYDDIVISSSAVLNGQAVPSDC